MAGNTEILIKRSLSTNKPSTALQGELAYSYSSNTLFIGTPNGDGAIEIGAWSDLSGLTAGYYGDATHIPTIHVDQHGKVISVSNNQISTTMNFNDNKGGTGSINLLTGSLDYTGTQGIVTTASGNTLTISTDNTIVRSNTAFGYQTIDGDVQISGNLTVTGTQTIINVSTIRTDDSLLYLAGNNYTSDIVDIGFVGNYYNGSSQEHAGVFRHAGDKQFYIFGAYTPEPSANTINPADPSFQLATTHTNLTSDRANVAVQLNVTGTTTLTGQANTVNDLGVGGNLYVTGKTVLTGQANTTNDLGVAGNIYGSGKIVANESTGTSGGGFAFQGDQTTGVFSPSAGAVHFYANNTDTAYYNSSYWTISKNLYLSGLNAAETSYILYWNNSTGEVTTGSMADLRPTELANGSYYLSLSGTDGSLTSSTGKLLINTVGYTAHQDATYDGIVFYNANTKEVRYSYVLDGGSF